MAVSALLSTLTTVLLLLVVVVSVSIAGRRRRLDRPGSEREFPSLAALRGPAGWTLGFLLAALVLGVGAVVAVSDGGFLPGLGSELQPAVLVGLSAVLGLYVLFGTYYAARSRGLQSSLAAAVSVSLLALVLVAVVMLQLVGVI